MDKKISSPYSITAKYLLYSLLLFSPLARGSVLYWHHTVIEIFTVAIVCVLLLEKSITGSSLQRRTALDLPLLALGVLFLISFLFSQSRNDSAAAFILLLSYVALFYATIYCIRTREDVLELVYVICGIGVLLTLIGFFKYAGVTLSFWTYDDLHYPDAFLSGVYGNHNHMAGYLEMVIPLLLALFLTRTRTGVWWCVLLGTVIMCTSGHILTLSRGGWIALVVSLTFMALVLMLHNRFRRKKLLALLFSSGVLLLLFILSGSDLFQRLLTIADDETVLGMGGRMIIWKGTLAMMKDYLAIGIGPGTFATVFPQYQPAGSTSRFYQVHNDYLHFLAELGVLFLPLLGWFLFSLFKTGGQKLQSTSRQTWGIALGAMTGIVAILAHSFVDFNLHIPANAILFTILAALVVGGPVRRSVDATQIVADNEMRK
jgi:O-antigen ligase